MDKAAPSGRAGRWPFARNLQPRPHACNRQCQDHNPGNGMPAAQFPGSAAVHCMADDSQTADHRTGPDSHPGQRSPEARDTRQNRAMICRHPFHPPGGRNREAENHPGGRAKQCRQ